MKSANGSTTPPADLRIEDGHFGASLMRLLGAAGLHVPGEPVANALIVGTSLDIAAFLAVIGLALRAVRLPYVDLRHIVHAIDCVQRLAEFAPMAARALDEANPPRPQPLNDNVDAPS